MPVFIGYDQAERMLAALLDQAVRWQPDTVAGIARGGLVPASMAAGILALPLVMVATDRYTGVAGWIGPAPVGRRILLVDDCCATGRTMSTTRAALRDAGCDVLTLTVVHDPETTAFVPDLSHPMRELFRFPWERGEATPAARALRATGAAADRATEAPFVGLDLDGVFLPDIPRAEYEADVAAALLRRHALKPFASVPFFVPERAVVITGRPDSDRVRTAEWVARWLHAAVPVECRPAALPHDALTVTRYKAEAATRWGCTHFIESDAEQAIRIAALAPHLIVSWWSAAEGCAWVVGASVNATPPP
ncbi:MAG TPA: phosphoribosyltransferase [Acetobacteraceae bacterium]|nr:phosphoribosyltransferase [Acetobacteraceae bacterium]